MSTTNETKTLSNFTKAGMVIDTYFNIFEYAGADGTYSRVFKYYTHPSEKGNFTPEFVREVLDSLEENLTTYGPAKAKVATLYPYI